MLKLIDFAARQR